MHGDGEVAPAALAVDARVDPRSAQPRRLSLMTSGRVRGRDEFGSWMRTESIKESIDTRLQAWLLNPRHKISRCFDVDD